MQLKFMDEWRKHRIIIRTSIVGFGIFDLLVRFLCMDSKTRRLCLEVPKVNGGLFFVCGLTNLLLCLVV